MSQRHEDPDFLKNAETAANEAEDRAIEHIGAEVVSQAVEFLDTHSDRVDKEVRSVIEATAASKHSAYIAWEKKQVDLWKQQRPQTGRGVSTNPLITEKKLHHTRDRPL